MRTKQQEWFRYNGLSVAAFADEISVSEQHVRNLVDSGWFGWVDEERAIPECMDVSAPRSDREELRFHPSAAMRFRRERARGMKKKEAA